MKAGQRICVVTMLYRNLKKNPVLLWPNIIEKSQKQWDWGVYLKK